MPARGRLVGILSLGEVEAVLDELQSAGFSKVGVFAQAAEEGT